MDWSQLAIALVFALLGLGCLLVVVLGLPGTWILLGLAVGVELFDGGAPGGAQDPVTFGWRVIAIGAVLAAIGEGLEALATWLGAGWGGATRRGMIGALVGGIVGAIVLTPLVPVPLLGTLIGALVGTFAGAVFGEWTAERRRSTDESLRAAWAAVLGRLAGTFGKLGIGVAVWVLLVYAAFTTPGLAAATSS